MSAKSENNRSKAPFKAPKKIGIVIKKSQREATAFAIEVARYILSRGASVVIAAESSDVAGLLKKSVDKPLRKRIFTIDKPKLADTCDLITVFGGDGTFLSVARMMKNRSIPVMGVNMGQLGFLTEIKREEAISSVGQILDGVPPIISERALLEVTLERKRKIIFQGPVVNDAVISKGAIARIIGLQVAINGTWAHDVRADGIIVSTPTGSTAYSLAAGGPFIEPSLEALVLTPICPHSLTQRPIVISDREEIQIRLAHRPGHVLLTLDGQDVVTMQEDDLVTVRRFKKHSLQLISSPSRDYFSLLREKLKFGARD